MVLYCSGAQEERGPDGVDSTRPRPAGNGVASPLQTFTKIVGTRYVVKQPTCSEEPEEEEEEDKTSAMQEAYIYIHSMHNA